jgi:hypothetical protein
MVLEALFSKQTSRNAASDETDGDDAARHVLSWPSQLGLYSREVKGGPGGYDTNAGNIGRGKLPTVRPAGGRPIGAPFLGT